MKPVNEMTVEEQKEWLTAQVREALQKHVGDSIDAEALRKVAAEEIQRRISLIPEVHRPLIEVRHDPDDPTMIHITYTPVYPLKFNIVFDMEKDVEEDTGDYITCDDCCAWASETNPHGHLKSCSHARFCTCEHSLASHEWQNRPAPISRARAQVCTVEGCSCWKFEEKEGQPVSHS